MKYPSYAVQINTIEELDGIRTTLGLFYVDIKYVTTYPETYYVDSKFQRCVPAPLNIPIVSYEEFIKIYEDFYKELHMFINSLKPGDKVFIEERRGTSECYPYSFAAGMTRYSGKKMTIVYTSEMSAKGRSFSNGSNKCFYMKEDSQKYTWHSSMFEMIPPTPIKILNLSDISINPLIIQ